MNTRIIIATLLSELLIIAACITGIVQRLPPFPLAYILLAIALTVGARFNFIPKEEGK